MSSPSCSPRSCRRLDPDDVYAETVERLCKIADKNGIRRTQAAKAAATTSEPAPMVTGTDATLAAGKDTQRSRRASAARKEASKPRKGSARKTAARKRAAKKSATRRTTKKS